MGAGTMTQGEAQPAADGGHGPFAGKLAVVTGGGSGMGRELVRQLAAAGCSVATCDVHEETVAETAVLARAGAPGGVGPGGVATGGVAPGGVAPGGVRVTSHVCDVA